MTAPAKPARTGQQLSIRVDLAQGVRIGPGKVALLEAVSRTGSISGAGRALRMSYRRAWDLIEELNRTIGCPVVVTASGGAGGGGASLTEAGTSIVAEYRAIEAEAEAACRRHLAALTRVCSRT